ncbi:DUF3329 domain-containing protein [Mesorhizobium sp. RP14(2022)]|uniref:DUF3329 domain-containing protein n=1 Tax=Mesorhizobium liriopis TaxID=2953882 RepID=A0ABT1C3I8_9HYPH|nr:DUF3329 domain-containing protein [Mesorhizobium liriopis]MCO6049398.1 DUF3329 domain-containing protein [Mesorhizobium liriopis]
MSNGAEHPFLRPLWRRAALVAFCAFWSAFEFATGSSGWGMMVGFMAVYGAWNYLIDYRVPPAEIEQSASDKAG